jgi:hypothetical protein
VASSAKKSPVVIILIAVAAACFPLVAILAAILFPVFQQARMAASRTASLRNVKTIATGFMLYASQNDDRMPPAVQWQDAMQTFVDPKNFKPPRAGDPASYALNQGLGDLRLYEINRADVTPLIFEARLPGPNAIGGEANVYPFGNRAVIAFSDASARTIPTSDLSGLVWQAQPKP